MGSFSFQLDVASEPRQATFERVRLSYYMCPRGARNRSDAHHAGDATIIDQIHSLGGLATRIARDRLQRRYFRRFSYTCVKRKGNETRATKESEEHSVVRVLHRIFGDMKLTMQQQ